MNGEIITTLGMDYQVQLPGNRTVWPTPGLAAQRCPRRAARTEVRHPAPAGTDELRR